MYITFFSKNKFIESSFTILTIKMYDNKMLYDFLHLKAAFFQLIIFNYKKKLR